jgi:Glutamyl- and glutaminyl-tRNA synthetases
LGHVANAIYVWGMVRAAGGRVLLRLEDHDRQRCRPEYEEALLEDLEWLGFTPDQPSCAELRQGPSSFRQSDNQAAYESALEALRTRHRVYACECSRRDEANRTDRTDGTARSEEGETAGEVPYSGRCRDRGLAPGPGRGLRVVIDPGEETFTISCWANSAGSLTSCGDLSA